MNKKPKLKTLLAALGLAGGAVALTVPALAGAIIPASNNVVRVAPGQWADGAVRHTRDSSDTTAYIFCTVYSTTTSDFGRCSARDPAGDYVTCQTTEPRMVAAMRSLQPESRIYFSASGGTCTWVEVHMDSSRLP